MSIVLFLAVFVIVVGLRVVILKKFFTRVTHENYMAAANDLLISRPARGQYFCLGAAIYYTPEPFIHVLGRALGVGSSGKLIIVSIDRLLGYIMWLSILITGLLIFF